MKKTAGLLSLALAFILTLTTAAFAAEPVLLWEAENLDTFDPPVAAVSVYSYPEGYGVMGLDGQVITPCQYARISTTDCVTGYFVAAQGDDVNSASLLDLTGAVLTADRYGDIKMLSEAWVVAVKLEVTTDEEYDYWGLGTSDHYNITVCDVYYLPSGGKVGSFTRDAYQAAVAHGDYLLVSDREGNVQLYDSSLSPVDSAFEYIYDDPYYIASKGLSQDVVVSRITGEVIASGYEDVEDVYGNLICVSTEDDVCGLIDQTGAVVLPCEYEDVDETGSARYLQVEKDDMIGLFDLEKQALVVPCEYDDVVTPNYDVVCYNGYFLMEKDGLIGYVAEGGAATTGFTYAESDVTLLGCTMLAAGEDGGYTLIAADGVVTALTGVTNVHSWYDNTLGYYIVVENAASKWGVVDWHGNQVVDFCMDSPYDFNFVNTTYLIVDDECVYEIK